MIRWLFCVVACCCLCTDAAPLQVRVLGKRIIVDKEGEHAEEAESLSVGDLIQYEIVCINENEHPVKNAVIEVPVPVPTSYVGSSATEGAEIFLSCSIDGADSFHEEPIRVTRKNAAGDGEVDAIAGPRSYTHLRWQLPQLAPNQRIQVEFRSRVKAAGAGLELPATVTTRAAPKPRRVNALPPEKPRTLTAVLGWSKASLPLLTKGRWVSPTGWTDQYPGRVRVTGQGVELNFKAGARQTRWSKAVAACQLSSKVTRDQALVMDVYSSLKTTSQLAVAVQTGAFIESRPIQILPGVNKNVMFDLQSKTFKSEASNWSYRTGLQPKTKVQEWYLIFYPQAGEGRYEIRNIRLFDPE